MSNSYVRAIVKQWLSQYPSVPFFDTNNIEQNPPVRYWQTVDWGFATRQRETFCDTTTERGAFTVVFFGPGGVGDTDLLVRAEPIMDDLIQQVDPAGKLALLVYDSPTDFLQGPWFGLEFSVEYEFRT